MEATKQRGRVRVETGAKRVRAYLGGELVADTTRPLLVWEVPYYPTYYFPAGDIRAALIEEDGAEPQRSPSRGDAVAYSVVTAKTTAHGAALRYPESPIEELRDAVRLDWPAMDAWFEEDEEIFTHPRDPYTRVDILASSRHVRIEVGGETVAESTRPTLLFETGLPARYYLPKTHVRMDLLASSETITHCPYKGKAEHFRIEGEEKDVAWSYPAPLPESAKIAGLVAFYNERVDVYVDGEQQQRPRTKFS